MLIEKVWSSGYKHKGDYKRWQGWFLFGFIPLFIRQTHYQSD